MIRRKSSSGQAIVMVSLALFAMFGLMGLAVDLGWSFFVQKQAQAAADGAALAAVQEAVARLGAAGNPLSGFTCSNALTGSGAGQIDCETSGVVCGNSLGTISATVAAASNLNNGCKYAAANSFNPSSTSPFQAVALIAGAYDTVAKTGGPPTAPGVVQISYWVIAKTYQTVPQLFSAISGNMVGTVSAVATAAIAGSIQPGSFYGMNRAGDCTNASNGFTCGLDVVTGNGGGNGKGGTQACGNVTSDLCAPAGFVLASSCTTGSTSAQGCSQQYAGDDKGKGAAGASLTIMGPSGSVNGTWENLNGGSLTATHTTNAATFADPTAPNSQPPLMATSAIPSCGIPSGTVPSGTTLGPWQYYSIDPKTKVPNGAQISLGGNNTFSASAPSTGCSGITGAVYTAGATANASFPTYIFWGGLTVNNDQNFTPGQYVMAGVSSNAANSTVMTLGGNITGDSSTGTMFIFTDGNYPGLSTQLAAIPSNSSMPVLYQGQVALGNNNTITLNGLVNSSVSGSNLPASMDPYTGIVWWQDRRNSTVGYNESATSTDCSAAGVTCTGDNGSVISCGIGCTYGSQGAYTSTNVLATVNHVTSTSPGGVQFANGNTKVALNGVYYQPRGAWVDFGNGNTGFNCPNNTSDPGACPLQVITGAVIMGNGNTRMVLAGPSNPTVQYRAVLIQ